MKKALILLFVFGASMLGLSLFASSSETTAAKVEVPFEKGVQEKSAIPARAGFDVDVLINGVPLPEYYARGRMYIEASEGAEYELRIRNPLGERVAVALAVDGLNSIDARHTAATNASKWVIEPYGTITISGWQMSSERARRFYFTTERDSYGAKLGQTSNLGLISAVFFRERHPVVDAVPRRSGGYDDKDGRIDSEREPSAGQSRDRNNDSAAPKSKSAEAYPGPDDESAATGIGRNVRHDVRWVNMDLENRATAEVTLRYEYRAGLVRLGIRPFSYPYPNPDTLPRRENARGFEGRPFSPEP